MASLEEVKKFLKKSVDWLKDEDMGCTTLKLDDRLAICVGWLPGYGEEKRDDCIQSREEPDFAINAGIKVWTSDDMRTDYEFINMPYYKDGEVIMTDISVEPSDEEDGYEHLAKWLLDSYDGMKDLNIEENGLIIEEEPAEKSHEEEPEEVEESKEEGLSDSEIFDVLGIEQENREKEEYKNLLGQFRELAKKHKTDNIWLKGDHGVACKGNIIDKTDDLIVCEESLEEAKVDVEKCKDILNNQIDWTEVDETGDVDFARNQLRSLETEKAISKDEYDYIVSHWDELLESKKEVKEDSKCEELKEEKVAYTWKKLGDGSEDWFLVKRGESIDPDNVESKAIVTLSRMNRFFPWSVYVGDEKRKDVERDLPTDYLKDIKEYILAHIDEILSGKKEEACEKGECKKSIKESWDGESVIGDLADRAKDYINDGYDIDEAVQSAIDDGLIYTSDIMTLLEHYGSIDDSEIIESYYDDLYSDVYSQVEDYEPEVEDEESEEEEE